jgi:hypothetical protein
MPVLSMMRMQGDPDDLLQRIKEHVEPVTERLGPQHGALLNIVARDGDSGILIVNLWETEEGRHATAAEPEVRDALTRAGLPAPAFEGYEVLAIRGTEKLSQHATMIG